MAKTDLTKMTLTAILKEYAKLAPNSDKLDHVKKWVEAGSLSRYSNQDFDMLQSAMRVLSGAQDIKTTLDELDKKEKHQLTDYDCAAYEYLLNAL